MALFASNEFIKWYVSVDKTIKSQIRRAICSLNGILQLNLFLLNLYVKYLGKVHVQKFKLKKAIIFEALIKMFSSYQNVIIQNFCWETKIFWAKIHFGKKILWITKATKQIVQKLVHNIHFSSLNIYCVDWLIYSIYFVLDSFALAL